MFRKVITKNEHTNTQTPIEEIEEIEESVPESVTVESDAETTKKKKVC